jgi:glutamate racemase
LTRPIGVFDSGIGGLSILKALRAALPHEDFIYLADNGHAPYGERDAAHVIARSRAVTQHLVKQNIKALVVACNTATAAAIDRLRTEHPDLPIIGVEPALKPAVALSKTGRIGVMATRSTLASPRFQALVAAQAGVAEFVLQPCDGLADAIERGASNDDATEIIAACARNTWAMGLFGTQPGQIDTLVLGCTHYPFVSEQLQALVGADVTLVENGAAVAQQTLRQLHTAAADTDPAMTMTGTGRITLFTTGDARTLKAATAHWLALRESVNLLRI